MSKKNSNNHGHETHVQRRELAYEYFIRRMSTAEIARKLEVSQRTVFRLIAEQRQLNRAAREARGDDIEDMNQEYIDAQKAIILKAWSILEDPHMKITSQNISGLVNAISVAEERIAKALGLLIDRSKIEAEINGKLSIIDLMKNARERLGD